MQKMTPQEQYQRRTPMNNGQMIDYPLEEYQRGSSNNMMQENYSPEEYQYQRGSPNNNMQRTTPKE